MRRYLALFTLAFLLLLAGSVFAASPDDNKGKLNLNKATVAELVKVPGLNETLATKILELRKVNGEFVDMSELLQVQGIDNKLLRQIEKHLYIEKAADCNC